MFSIIPSFLSEADKKYQRIERNCNDHYQVLPLLHERIHIICSCTDFNFARCWNPGDTLLAGFNVWVCIITFLSFLGVALMRFSIQFIIRFGEAQNQYRKGRYQQKESKWVENFFSLTIKIFSYQLSGPGEECQNQTEDRFIGMCKGMEEFVKDMRQRETVCRTVLPALPAKFIGWVKWLKAVQAFMAGAGHSW